MIAEDPFAKYLLSNQKQQEQAKPQEMSENDPFAQYRLNKPEEEESYFNQALRHGSRSLSRLGEQVIGLGQGSRDFLNSVVDPIVEPLMEKAFGKEVTEKRRKAQEETRILPRSSELKAASEEASKGYTKAQNEYEKMGDQFVETTANLLGPMKFRKALGLAAGSTLAKEGVKLAGLGEGAQEAAKFGTLLLGSMYNPKGVKNLYENYYNEAAKHIPAGTQVTAGPFLYKLDKLEKQLQKGLNAPSESAVLKVIDDAKNKIQNGKLFVEDMVASRRSLNEIRGDPALLKRGKTLLNDVAKIFDDAVKLYKNPDFIKNYRSANEAFGALAESMKASNFILRNIGSKPLIKSLFVAGAEAFAGHPELIAPTVGVAGAVGAGIKSYELLHRIMNSKVMRKYYADMLINAGKENARGAIASADKLEKALEK